MKRGVGPTCQAVETRAITAQDGGQVDSTTAPTRHRRCQHCGGKLRSAADQLSGTCRDCDQRLEGLA